MKIDKDTGPVGMTLNEWRLRFIARVTSWLSDKRNFVNPENAFSTESARHEAEREYAANGEALRGLWPSSPEAAADDAVHGF